jgi:hypothetical protein
LTRFAITHSPRPLRNHENHFLGDPGGGAPGFAPPATKDRLFQGHQSPKTPQVLPLYAGMTDGPGMEGNRAITDLKPERHRRAPVTDRRSPVG